MVERALWCTLTVSSRLHAAYDQWGLLRQWHNRYEGNPDKNNALRTLDALCRPLSSWSPYPSTEDKTFSHPWRTKHDVTFTPSAC
ncbi:hypothetical protein L227DRAFT_213948 [Lentinus tigrinus ALCF2SS1-6]|uniref:Uncharacterized protein n=1 Tax=Lentinus tigrinus ALCF2SS1-6 TaxID=1328759 RepID=A0A5C2SR00_9APHY|nr:hypothetical protein L227DRAFT_213948 [Lentinus tigrinus ALCF2SS1-6]